MNNDEFSSTWHKCTCPTCGNHYWLQGKLGSGKARCKACVADGTGLPEKKQSKRHDKQKAWSVFSSPDGGLPRLMRISTYEIVCMLMYGSIEPYTHFKSMEDIKISGRTFSAGQIAYVRYDNRDAILVSNTTGDVLFRRRRMTDWNTDIEELPAAWGGVG